MVEPITSLVPATAARGLAARIADNVERAVVGKRPQVEVAIAALVARGHLLIEDVPGVGKTTLAQALARSFDLSFARIQFTSDLLPSDILGAQVFEPQTSSFSFKPGPIFAQLVLADELNRAPPRTQSALLEAMSDGQVSLDGSTRVLPQPFAVLATQNPLEQAGTYPLPDSQLDRFLVRITLGYPPADAERSLLLTRGFVEPVRSLTPVARASDLAGMQTAAASVRVDPAVADYLLAIIDATRKTRVFAGGASTRGGLALQAAAKARALLAGRDFVTPDDVKALVVPCLAHRVVVSGRDSSSADRRDAERALQEILGHIEVPL
jgi:MoxR-like ATPase